MRKRGVIGRMSGFFSNKGPVKVGARHVESDVLHPLERAEVL